MRGGRAAAFERLQRAVDDAVGELEGWEVDELLEVLQRLERTSPRAAEDRQRHGFVR